MICPRCNVDHETFEVRPGILVFYCPYAPEDARVVSVNGRKQIPDIKRKMMVLLSKSFDDEKQNFPYHMYTYSFCCEYMHNMFRFGSIRYDGPRNEIFWDANLDEEKPFNGVPIRHCPWCNASVTVLDQPILVKAQSDVPEGHKCKDQ